MGRRQQPVESEKGSVHWEIMHENWFQRLNELQTRWVPNTPENSSIRESLLREAWQYAYMGCMQFRGNYTDDERSRASEYLLADLKRFDPIQKSLGAYVEYQIAQRLRDAYHKELDIVYSPSARENSEKKVPIKEGFFVQPIQYERAKDGAVQEIEPADPRPGPAEIHARVDNMQTVMQAMVLNFATLKDQKRRGNTLRHHRIFYTEHITWAAQDAPLPERWGRDILKALNGPYFRYFVANAPEAQALSLPDIENAILKMEGQVIPGKAMDKPLTWDAEGLLPAKVQISFFARDGVKIPPSTVSLRRTEYRKSLQEICSKCLF